MFTLRAKLTNDLNELVSTKIIYIEDYAIAKQLMELIQIPEETTDEPVSARVVTPLPPGYEKEGKIDGLIRPKSPLEFKREQNKRLSRLPKELKDEQE